MAQYSAETAHPEPVVSSVADPIPLGMSAFAFTTAILGCTFASFILPGVSAGINLVVAAALFYGGIIQILAGMWEFRKDNTVAATIFSSYGGFLVAFGVIFLPGFGIFQALNRAAILHPALGLFFLCWTIFSALLFLGSLRTNLALLIVLALMFLSYLFLTIGELAGASAVLLIIGGWLSIVCALVAWYTALADMLRSAAGPFKLPMGWIR
jgi:succinate-acetate transporter protein